MNMLIAQIIYTTPSNINFYWTERSDIDENYFWVRLWDKCEVYPMIELFVSLELLREEEVKEILESPVRLRDYYLILRRYLHEGAPRCLLKKKVNGIEYPNTPQILDIESPGCCISSTGSYQDFWLDCAQAEIDFDSFKE